MRQRFPEREEGYARGVLSLLDAGDFDAAEAVSAASMARFAGDANRDGAVLEHVNLLCRRFGSKIHIRFYGHYGGDFDCCVLRQIPEVRWLGLDSLKHARNLGVLNELANLEG